MKTISETEHLARHILLHRHFDELFADFIEHHPQKTQFLLTPIKEIMEWSFKQTVHPAKLPK